MRCLAASAIARPSAVSLPADCTTTVCIFDHGAHYECTTACICDAAFEITAIDEDKGAKIKANAASTHT